MGNCIYKIGSITIANKAKRALSAHSVYVQTVKLSSGSGGGCVHGIEFNCNQKSNVTHLLLREGINFEEYSR